MPKGQQFRGRAAEGSGHVEAVSCSCSRAQQCPAARRLAEQYDVRNDAAHRRLRSVAPGERDAVRVCQRQQAVEKAVKP